MWLTEQSLELVSVFEEANRNLIVIVPLNKADLKLINHLHMYRKY